MKKCLRVTFSGDYPEDFLREFIQKHARKFNLEGSAQAAQETIRLMICGEKEDIDGFLDVLHKGGPAISLENITIEPFVRDRDYRGIFRVIE